MRLKLLIIGCVVSLGSHPSFADELIEAAKGVISSHEHYAMANDLDGVMTNVAEDIVILTSGVPLVEGSSDFRGFYAAILESGRILFGHEYAGAESIGDDVVVLHGVSRGTITSSDGSSSKFSNSFIHVLKRSGNGSLKIWRASFAPDGSMTAE